MRCDNEKLKSMLREAFDVEIAKTDLLVECLRDDDRAVDIMVDVAFSTFQNYLVRGTLAAAEEMRDG